MKKTLIFISLTILIALSINSCKKKIYGCTNWDALNYSLSANTDDGSCFFASDINTDKQRIFIENFNLTFTNQSFYSYSPSFNYENGDFLLVEGLTDYAGGESYWSSLPLTSIGANVTIWYEYSQSFGTIYVYTTTVNNGNTYNWSPSASQTFRAVLIKKDALIENPDLRNMSYDEIIEVM